MTSKKRPSAKLKTSDGVVYSTNSNFKYENRPNQNAIIPISQQQLRIFLDKKNRAGKTVTIISGYVGKEEDLEKLARELKSKCGVGGSVKEREIIIQGDHRERIVVILQKAGYQTKKI